MKRKMHTAEENTFRKIGRGIPPERWWPFLAIFFALILTQSTNLAIDCTGFEPEGRRAKALFGLIVAYPCSFFLMKGSSWDWVVFFSLWVPIPFAIINWRWAKRSAAYWKEIDHRALVRKKAGERHKESNKN